MPSYPCTIEDKMISIRFIHATSRASATCSSAAYMNFAENAADGSPALSSILVQSHWVNPALNECMRFGSSPVEWSKKRITGDKVPVFFTTLRHTSLVTSCIYYGMSMNVVYALLCEVYVCKYHPRRSC